MSDYPRDLVNKDGVVKEFKSKDAVPPGWFIRDTMEEVNPLPPALAEKPAKKIKVGKAAHDEGPEPAVGSEPEAE